MRISDWSSDVCSSGLEILGLPKRKGRHPVLDETQDTELWRQWKAVTSSRNVDLEDETSILDAAMDLAEGMSLPLSVVWAAIRNWEIGRAPGRERVCQYV